MFNELKNRGLHDILIAVVDGLRGFAEAIEAVYPAAQIQSCIVHLIRNSLKLASWKARKPLAAAIKPIYQAATAEAAAAALWPCATSKRTGRCHLSPGSKPPISSRSCSANDSLAPSDEIF